MYNAYPATHYPGSPDYAAPRPGGPMGWLRRAEDWLDARGKPAWIAAMVLGFVFVWPVGLAILAYMIWSKKRMFGRSCRHRGDHRRHSHEFASFHAMRGALRPSGNVAFDAYKAETLRRLQDEQEAFDTFLQRLRAAKDKSEFDAFMEDRARNVADAAARGDDRTETGGPAEPDHPAKGY